MEIICLTRDCLGLVVLLRRARTCFPDSPVVASICSAAPPSRGCVVSSCTAGFFGPTMTTSLTTRERHHVKESWQNSMHQIKKQTNKQKKISVEVFACTSLIDADKSFLADLLQQSFKIWHSCHHQTKGQVGVHSDWRQSWQRRWSLERVTTLKWQTKTGPQFR